MRHFDVPLAPILYYPALDVFRALSVSFEENSITISQNRFGKTKNDPSFPLEMFCEFVMIVAMALVSYL
jgi:hypothetical protein